MTDVATPEPEVFQRKSTEPVAGGVIDLGEVGPGQTEHQDHHDPERQLNRVAHGNSVNIQGRVYPDHVEQEG